MPDTGHLDGPVGQPPLTMRQWPPPPAYYEARECPGCGRVMSAREAAEQAACNDCHGGAYDPNPDQPTAADLNAELDPDIDPRAQRAAVTFQPVGSNYCPDCRHVHDMPGETEALLTCRTCARVGLACDIRTDLPPGATLEPWTDADTDELRDQMSRARARVGARWSEALRRSADQRRERIMARTTFHPWHEPTTPWWITDAAARVGIVPDYRHDPTHLARMRELGDVRAAIDAARAYKTTHEARGYEASDGFDEHERLTYGPWQGAATPPAYR